MSDRELLSGADNAWRRMGTAQNLMTITGVMSFDETVGYEELCERLEERLLRFDRFEQRIGGRKRSVRRPYWERMRAMDIRTHVYDISLPEPADKDTFERFIGNLVSRPLDERRPLWEAYLIEDAGSGDGNAIAFRLNHSIGDGFALLSVLLGLVDNPGEINLPMGSVPMPQSVDSDDSSSDDVHTDAGTRKSATDSTTTGSGRFSSPDLGPIDILRKGATGVTMAAQGVKIGYDLLTMDDDTQTSLHRQIGTAKRVAWTEEIDLTKIKRIGKAHETTVNDVLLGATAGGLRRIFEQRDQPTDGLEVRCTVPVNLKGMEGRDDSLGNYFGLAFIPIPVGTHDLSERIRTIRERTTKRKLGIEASIIYGLLEIGGRLPEYVQKKVMTHFTNKSMGVFTNVPGPTNTLEFGGKEICDVMFWVPQSVDQGMGISIFSYDGGVRVGVNSDENVLAEPGQLTDALESEVEMLANNTD